jgi:hypothetical protein
VFAVGLNGFLYAAGTITVYVNTESSHWKLTCSRHDIAEKLLKLH